MLVSQGRDYGKNLRLGVTTLWIIAVLMCHVSHVAAGGVATVLHHGGVLEFDAPPLSTPSHPANGHVI